MEKNLTEWLNYQIKQSDKKIENIKKRQILLKEFLQEMLHHQNQHYKNKEEVSILFKNFEKLKYEDDTWPKPDLKNFYKLFINIPNNTSRLPLEYRFPDPKLEDDKIISGSWITTKDKMLGLIVDGFDDLGFTIYKVKIIKKISYGKIEYYEKLLFKHELFQVDDKLVLYRHKLNSLIKRKH